MANKRMVITECNGRQIYKSDFTFAESITLLEIWKTKLIQEKIAAQEAVEGDLQQTHNRLIMPVCPNFGTIPVRDEDSDEVIQWHICKSAGKPA